MADEERKQRRVDIVAAAARSATSLLPGIGGFVSEAINFVIPSYKEERINDFLKILDEKVRTLEADQEVLARRFREGESLDLFEEGIQQAARAVSQERKHNIAAILAHSLTEEELKYAQTRKLLNVLRDLTDPEVVYLKAFSLRGEDQRVFYRQHSAILRPASKEVGIEQEEIDRGALQDSYQQTLIRHGLCAQRGGGGTIQLTSLGRLLLRYIEMEHKA